MSTQLIIDNSVPALFLIGLISLSYLLIYKSILVGSAGCDTNLRLKTMLISTVLIIVAVLGYSCTGGYKNLIASFNPEDLATKKLLQKAFVAKKKLETSLLIKVAQDFSDIASWQQLSKLYLAEKNFVAAEEAFRNISMLAKDTISFLKWLNVKVQTGDGVLSDFEREILTNYKNKSEYLDIVLNTLAIDAYNSADFAAAITYWQLLLPLVEDTAEYQAKQAISRLIKETQLNLK